MNEPRSREALERENAELRARLSALFPAEAERFDSILAAVTWARGGNPVRARLLRTTARQVREAEEAMRRWRTR